MAFNWEFNGVKLPQAIIDSSKGAIDELGQGLKNLWYSWTGQTEKTSAYKAMMEREDTAYQRAASDMEAAGLSKYGGFSQSSSTSPQPSSDPLTKSLQLASAMLDLKAKQAGVRKTEAETDNVAANTAYTQKTINTYDDKFMADFAYTNMHTMYLEAQKKLAETNSWATSEKTLSELEVMSSQVALNLSHRDYFDELVGKTALESNYQAKVNRDYDYRFQMEIDKHSEAIAKSVAERNHLGYQDTLLLKQVAARQLETDVLHYNWNYSKEHGLRTTDQVSRFMGINVDSGGQMLSDLSKKVGKYVLSPAFLKAFLPGSLRSVYDNMGL